MNRRSKTMRYNFNKAKIGDQNRIKVAGVKI